MKKFFYIFIFSFCLFFLNEKVNALEVGQCIYASDDFYYYKDSGGSLGNGTIGQTISGQARGFEFLFDLLGTGFIPQKGTVLQFEFSGGSDYYSNTFYNSSFFVDYLSSETSNKLNDSSYLSTYSISPSDTYFTGSYGSWKFSISANSSELSGILRVGVYNNNSNLTGVNNWTLSTARVCVVSLGQDDSSSGGSDEPVTPPTTELDLSSPGLPKYIKSDDNLNYDPSTNIVDSGSIISYSPSNDYIKLGWNNGSSTDCYSLQNFWSGKRNDNTSPFCYKQGLTYDSFQGLSSIIWGLSEYSSLNSHSNNTSMSISYNLGDNLLIDLSYHISLAYAFSLDSLNNSSLTDFNNDTFINKYFNYSSVYSGSSAGQVSNFLIRSDEIVGPFFWGYNESIEMSSEMIFVFIDFDFIPSETSSTLKINFNNNSSMSYNVGFFTQVYFPYINTNVVDSSSYDLISSPLVNSRAILSNLPNSGFVFFNECHDKNDSNQSNWIRNPNILDGTFYYWNGSTSDVIYKGIKALTFKKTFGVLNGPSPSNYYYLVKYDLSNYKGLMFLSTTAVGQDSSNKSSSFSTSCGSGFFTRISCGIKTTWNKLFGSSKINNSSSSDKSIDYSNYVCSFYVPKNSHWSNLTINYDENGNEISMSGDYINNGNLITFNNAFSSLDTYSTNLLSSFNLEPFNPYLTIFTSNFNHSYKSLDSSLQLFIVSIICILCLIFVIRRFKQ